MDYKAYLESLNETEEVVRGMYKTAEREVEWTLSDHDASVAKFAREKIFKGLSDALYAIEAQKEMCKENLQ